MEKLFAERKSIAFAEYVKEFWQRYLGKPHYEREIMDAGLVMKTRAFAATWVDSLQAGTLKSHRQHEMRSQGANQFSCDERGFILSGPDLIANGRRPRNWTLQRDPYLLETNVPGIFVAGDVRHGSIKRVASAVGEGSIAIELVHQYLNRF